ncbi:MAG: hypothetical protein K5666_02960 [Bacilli bacterium]|nr:hypothetical protein [Bacilli bacterium]
MLRKYLEDYRMKLLIEKGVLDGSIVPFDEEFYNRLKGTIISGIPVYFWIKYLKPTLPPGKCYDRSLYMFFALKDAILVRGNIKPLAIKYGEEDAGHGWIEMGDYVYDPTTLHRYTKKVYYKINKPYDVSKCSLDEYCENDIRRETYEDVESTTIDALRQDGLPRIKLSMTIPFVQAMTSLGDDFNREFNEYLESINYDYQEISDSIDRRLNETIKKSCN